MTSESRTSSVLLTGNRSLLFPGDKFVDCQILRALAAEIKSLKSQLFVIPALIKHERFLSEKATILFAKKKQSSNKNKAKKIKAKNKYKIHEFKVCFFCLYFEILELNMQIWKDFKPIEGIRSGDVGSENENAIFESCPEVFVRKL